ncbi:MAG: hypothetical protein ACI9OJ_004055 [Myxococcota bacterium]|jgi:hypothetical protein
MEIRMTKTILIVAAVLLFGSCEAVEDALNPVAHCDARETAAQTCLEYTGLATVALSSTYQEGCLGTWGSGVCSRTGMRGGCEQEISTTANLTITTWTLGTAGSAEAQASQSACESTGATWLQP